jgi:hypothetical protein
MRLYMSFMTATKNTDGVGGVLLGVLQPQQDTPAIAPQIGELIRQGLAVVLSALMIMVPMGQQAFAQEALPIPPLEQQQQQQAPPPAAADQQQVPEAQPLTNDQLDQLAAPIALYPDALVAQVLTAATYPTQVVQADRWLQAQGNTAKPDQIAAGSETQNWDASVKALTAFPTVLAQMDKNLQWTTDLGNAYYNQPQDVMDTVQAMRQKAQVAGNLKSTPQQTVTQQPSGPIEIVPANPTVVYVPVYNPWAIYGAPVVVYPGFYYGPPPGIFWGGLAVGFGVGIGIGLFAPYGWGWGHWGVGWGPGFGYRGAVIFNHTTYLTHSTTVINRGFARPGGPSRAFAGARGAYARPSGFNRPGYGHPVARASVSRPSGGPTGGSHPSTSRQSRSGHPSEGHAASDDEHKR